MKLFILNRGWPWKNFSAPQIFKIWHYWTFWKPVLVILSGFFSLFIFIFFLLLNWCFIGGWCMGPDAGGHDYLALLPSFSVQAHTLETPALSLAFSHLYFLSLLALFISLKFQFLHYIPSHYGCLRNLTLSVSWQLMALLLLRHALNITNADGDDDASNFFSVSEICVLFIW